MMKTAELIIKMAIMKLFNSSCVDSFMENEKVAAFSNGLKPEFIKDENGNIMCYSNGKAMLANSPSTTRRNYIEKANMIRNQYLDELEREGYYYKIIPISPDQANIDTTLGFPSGLAISQKMMVKKVPIDGNAPDKFIRRKNNKAVVSNILLQNADSMYFGVCENSNIFNSKVSSSPYLRGNLYEDRTGLHGTIGHNSGFHQRNLIPPERSIFQMGEEELANSGWRLKNNDGNTFAQGVIEAKKAILEGRKENIMNLHWSRLSPEEQASRAVSDFIYTPWLSKNINKKNNIAIDNEKARLERLILGNLPQTAFDRENAVWEELREAIPLDAISLESKEKWSGFPTVAVDIDGKSPTWIKKDIWNRMLSKVKKLIG